MSATWAYTLRDGAVHGEIFDSPADVPDGWTDSPAKAEAAPEADDKDALIAEAEGLGIDVDKRWGVKRLKAAIEDARA